MDAQTFAGSGSVPPKPTRIVRFTASGGVWNPTFKGAVIGAIGSTIYAFSFDGTSQVFPAFPDCLDGMIAAGSSMNFVIPIYVPFEVGQTISYANSVAGADAILIVEIG
jgi:hypothetical protein